MINLQIFNKIKFDSLERDITYTKTIVGANIWSETVKDKRNVFNILEGVHPTPFNIYETTRRNIENHLRFFHIDIVFNIKCGNMRYITKLTKQNILKAFK